MGKNEANIGIILKYPIKEFINNILKKNEMEKNNTIKEYINNEILKIRKDNLSIKSNAKYISNEEKK